MLFICHNNALVESYFLFKIGRENTLSLHLVYLAISRKLPEVRQKSCALYFYATILASVLLPTSFIQGNIADCLYEH